MHAKLLGVVGHDITLRVRHYDLHQRILWIHHASVENVLHIFPCDEMDGDENFEVFLLISFLLFLCVHGGNMPKIGLISETF